MEEKVKRTWHYIQKPHQHDIKCTKCGGANLDWSEFAKHVWCYDCKIDFDNYISVLDGPFPITVGALLGISTDRFLMDEKMIEHYDFHKKEYVKMTIEEYGRIGD